MRVRSTESVEVESLARLVRAHTPQPRLSLFEAIRRAGGGTLDDLIAAEFLRWQNVVRLGTGGGVTGLVRQAGLDANAALRDAVRALPDDAVDADVRSRAIRVLVARRRAIAASQDVLQVHRDQQLGRARHDARLAVDRERRVPAGFDTKIALSLLDEALADPSRFLFSPSGGRALDHFLSSFHTGREYDEAALVNILERSADAMLRFEMIKGGVLPAALNTLSAEQFAERFSPVISSVQGVLGEGWFWRSRSAADIRRLSVVGAEARADSLRSIGFDGEVVVIPDELFLISGQRGGGQCLLDGAVLIVDRSADHGGVVNACMAVAVEVKTGTSAENLLQLRRDQKREYGSAGRGVVVRTRDDSSRFRLIPAPDADEPVRLFVAPSTDMATARLLEQRYGIVAEGVVMPISAVEFRDVATFIVRVVLDM
ncbi:MAG: hypothetical protein EKK42_19025 [Pseudonocardiaceae bacterium]|nr:MAG: hypothetical protein EKK42_19025 [Pseudonocardiaceae bacterium]